MLAESEPLVQIERDESKFEGLRHEYTEINNTMRNYSILRFNIFTVFLVALGGLFSISFGIVDSKYADMDQLRLVGRIGGFFVTLLFFYYERRIKYLIKHSLTEGRELEGLLRYKYLTSKRQWDKDRILDWTKVFFVILSLLWFIMVIEMLVKVIRNLTNP